MIDASSTGQSNIAKNAKLFVSAFVNPTLVPLYCQTGPVLEVHITNADTAAWLKDRLVANTWLESEHQDGFQTVQCPTAVVLRVEDPSRRGSRNAQNAWDKVTDILVYGVITLSPKTHSSSASDSHDDSCNVNLRTYAVPMCGGRETKMQTLPTPPQSPGAEDITREAETAEFLPDMTSPSPKRKRVATLFDAATEFHKKAQRRGGIGISDFGKKEGSQQFTDSPYMRIKRERDNAHSLETDRGPSQASSGLRDSGRSRSPTLPATATVERQRTKSISGRRDTPGPFAKDATYSRFSNAPNPAPQSHKVASCGETISANKSLLTRTILTSMRLYGYRRSARAAARPTTPANPFPESLPNASASGPGDVGDSQEQSTFDADEDEEFKAMYHATYRASTFALKQFLKPCQICAAQAQSTGSSNTTDKSTTCISGLGRDRAVHVVDSILKLFCEGQG